MYIIILEWTNRGRYVALLKPLHEWHEQVHPDDTLRDMCSTWGTELASSFLYVEFWCKWYVMHICACGHRQVSVIM